MFTREFCKMEEFQTEVIQDNGVKSRPKSIFSVIHRPNNYISCLPKADWSALYSVSLAPRTISSLITSIDQRFPQDRYLYSSYRARLCPLAMEDGQAISRGELSHLTLGGQASDVIVRLIRIWDCIIPPVNMFVGIDFLVVDCQIVELTEPVQAFPREYFCFASYEDLIARDNQSWYLTDILGRLEAVTDVTPSILPNNKGTVFKRDLYLTLLTGQRVTVRLWDPKVDDLDVTYIIQLRYKPLLAIAGLHIKQYQGDHHCAVLPPRSIYCVFYPIIYFPVTKQRGSCIGYKCINSCSATRIYVDPNNRVAVEARQRFPLDGSMVDFISGDGFDNDHRFSFHDAHRTTVQQLLYTNLAAVKGMKFRVLGRIVRLEPRAGWYYYSCQRCGLGIKRLNSVYNCRIHGLTVSRRNLRISLIIEHAGFKLKVVVFGTLAHRLTGLDTTMLHFAQRLNCTTIPVDTVKLINMKYDFVLGVLGRNIGPGSYRVNIYVSLLSLMVSAFDSLMTTIINYNDYFTLSFYHCPWISMNVIIDVFFVSYTGVLYVSYCIMTTFSGEVELNLDYPNMRANHQATVGCEGILREIIKLIIAARLPALDEVSKLTIFKWFQLNQSELPTPEQTIMKLQHGHIQQEIYTRGLSNYLSPIMTGKKPVTDPCSFLLKSLTPKILLNGDFHRVFLITTQANYEMHVNLEYSVKPVCATTIHEVGFILQTFNDNSTKQPCNICKRSWGPSTSSSIQPVKTRILLYNAMGAASLDAAGFCGGSWMIWNTAITEVEIIQKASSKLTARVKMDQQLDLAIGNAVLVLPPRAQLPYATRELIVMLENLLGITYPIIVEDIPHQIMIRPELCEISKLVLGIHLRTRTHTPDSRTIVLTWLGLQADDIPTIRIILLRMQQPHILSGLLQNGLVNYSLPLFIIHDRAPSLADIHLQEAEHNFMIDSGDRDT
ncbi:Nucleic acid-binding protein [Corchorus olitorius]|uniref:Nucleic acid-binding protein n=1 Tax=Corchorus olitorius TaxID=93759 RepID=A0A1R3KGZ4_9ROSI|nr:Nucleic acid-binding protein [Corchorus olitorius]